MRRKMRGTIQIDEDVKRLFMLAKPLEVSSSDFLKGMLTQYAHEVRERQQRTPALAIDDVWELERKKRRLTCLGRPPGAKDIGSRRRRTKKELARAAQRKAG